MRTENNVNYKIDWHSDGRICTDKDSATPDYSKTVLADRIHYFSMLRRFLQDIKNLGRDEIDDIFAKYNVHLVDIDDIPRVNLDEPTNKEQA